MEAASYAFFLFCLSFGCSAQSWPNVAPTGTAVQSSTYLGGVAERAIDGDRNPDFPKNSCTLTAEGSSGHWWSLRLPGEFEIHEVRISNRRYAYGKLTDSEILIGNSLENDGNDNPGCASISSIPSASTETYKCGMFGSVVNVKMEESLSNTQLSLCEVEVYGEPVPPTFTLQAAGRTLVVVQRKLCWSDALFYCRDYYSDLVSLHHADQQGELESLLTSGEGSAPLTDHVWVGLRRELMGSTWFWMSGGHLVHTHWLNEHVWQLTSPCGAVATSGPFYWNNIPCGALLHFVCVKDEQPLEGRVQFYSNKRPGDYLPGSS